MYVFNLLCYTAVLVVVFNVGWEYYHYTETILELLADRPRPASSDTVNPGAANDGKISTSSFLILLSLQRRHPR